jgi:hypothetical protein
VGLDGKNGRERQKRKTDTPLHLVLAAFGALQGAPAPAAELERPSMETVMRYAKPNPGPSVFDQSFEKALAEKSIDKIAWSKMEKQVMDEEVALSSQIRFLQRAFRSDGPYMKTFEKRDLTEEMLSKILDLVGRVSARMNGAYENYKKTQQSVPGFEHLFQYAHTFENATKSMWIKRSDNTFLRRNVFFNHDSRGDVRLDTAEHCLPRVTPNETTFMVATDANPATTFETTFTVAIDADAATTIASQEMQTAYGLGNNFRLPILDQTQTPTRMAGQPVVSYSLSPNPDPDHKLKVYYSIAMPWTQPVRELALGKNIDIKAPFLKNQMFMVVPPEEQAVRASDAQGNPTAREMSGSSGSMVAMPGIDALRVVGSLTSIGNYNNSLKKLSYTIANFNTPATLEALAQRDRAEHPHGPLGDEK